MLENLEMPQIRTNSFSVLFPFQNRWCDFLESDEKNGAFQDFRTLKSGAFREKTRDRFENEKRIKNEYVRSLGNSGENAYALT